MNFRSCLLICLQLIVVATQLWAQRPQTVSLEQRHYLERLILEAQRRRLSEERYWRLLMHYRPHWLGGLLSEADGEGFFLSPDGKQNPEAELQATLRYFFLDTPAGSSQQQAQCAFPARYQWLKERLQFDPTLLHERSCERFWKGLGSLKSDAVTLIFASAYLNSPSSMFGHTLLRLDQKEHSNQTRLLDYTINYAAEIESDFGPAYVINGISGGFRGYFSIMPYYLKVQEYSEWENRDLWEYQLNFSQEQILKLRMHLWELGNTYFDYFFFRENCSYHLLSLLEIADPELRLTNEFGVWTAPAETVRLIASYPGLVRKITYRPSRSARIRHAYSSLSASQKTILYQLLDDITTTIDRPDYQRLSPGEQARLLDLVSDYLRYQIAEDSNDAEKLKKDQHQALTLRSQTSSAKKVFEPSPPISPDQGHETSRVTAGAGTYDQHSFMEFRYRAAYHDLLDADAGYSAYSQIQVFDAHFRYFPESEPWKLTRFTLADIISLFGSTPLFIKPSWKLKVGWENPEAQRCDECGRYLLNGGIGMGLNSQWIQQELWYVMTEMESRHHPHSQTQSQLGVGGTIGVVFKITPQWKAHIWGQVLDFPWSPSNPCQTLALQQSYSLARNIAILLDGKRSHDSNEIMLSVGIYF